jgi:hypothetical protein
LTHERRASLSLQQADDGELGSNANGGDLGI